MRSSRISGCRKLQQILLGEYSGERSLGQRASHVDPVLEQGFASRGGSVYGISAQRIRAMVDDSEVLSLFSKGIMSIASPLAIFRMSCW